MSADTNVSDRTRANNEKGIQTQTMGVKILLLFILSTIVSATSFAADYYAATTALNVRSGEGTEYAVSFTLQTGDEVEVLSKGSPWYRIKYLGKLGYVSSKYLKFSRTVPETNSPVREQSTLYLLIGIGICLLVYAFFIFAREARDKKLLKTVTELNRGERSERNLALRLLKFGVPAHVIFHDLLLEISKNNFTQIDLVVVTNAGILVFEVKDYSGLIYGSGTQFQWTKVLARGRQQYLFYNPIMQNNKHVTELKKCLQPLGDFPFYSIIVFYGNCILKEVNFAPEGTYVVKSISVLDVVKQILEKHKPVDYKNASEVLQVLKRCVTNGAILENQTRHKENIRNMLGRNRLYE